MIGLRQTALGWCPHDPCFAVRDGHGMVSIGKRHVRREDDGMPDSISINLFRFLPFVCVWLQSDVNFFVSPFVLPHLTDGQKAYYHQPLLSMAQQAQ